MTNNIGLLGDVLALGVVAKVTSDVSENFIRPKKRSSKKRKKQPYGDWR